MVAPADQLDFREPVRTQPRRRAGQQFIPVEHRPERFIRFKDAIEVTPCPCGFEQCLDFRPPIPIQRIGNVADVHPSFRIQKLLELAVTVIDVSAVAMS